MSHRISRRGFLASTIPLAAACHVGWGADPVRRPRVAAIFTEFRFRSHAYNILENCFRPYLFRGRLVDPGIDIVSMYADQFPKEDMAREVSKRLNVPLCPSISETLTLGTGQLAVDAVLSIVEQGQYPSNNRGQTLYPRKEFFDQSVRVMQQSNRFVPFFNDKHLSYRWDWAQQMYCLARSCNMPLMAGSSVPLAQRRPMLDLPPNADIDEALAIHGGGAESYDFHGLELLQSFVESRHGGETGISSIEFLSGEALARDTRWSRDLAKAALRAELAMSEVSRGLRKDDQPIDPDSQPIHGLIVRYRDGLRATVLKVGASSNRWNFACRLKGDPQIRATALFNGPWGNRNLFKALSHSIQHFFRTGRAPYPVERTLLVSGALDAAMWSNELKGHRICTPNLEWSYAPQDFSAFRETGESWQVLTRDTPEKKTFEPGDP